MNFNNKTQNISVSFDPDFINMLKNFKSKHSNIQSSANYLNGSTGKLNNSIDNLPSQNKRPSFNGTVDPIKSVEDIQAVKEYFLNQPIRCKTNHTNIRNYTLFVFTINCSRRIGDVLKLKIKDVLNKDMTFKNYIGENQSIGIQEQKTKKLIRIPINEASKEALQMYFNTLTTINFDDPIFKSPKEKNIIQAQSNYNKALLTGDLGKIKYAKDRLDIAINFTHSLEPRSVSKILKDMSRDIGLEAKGININTHSMRKTGAYHLYNKSHDIEAVAKLLNHTKSEVSKRYIGINQDEIDTNVLNLNL